MSDRSGDEDKQHEPTQKKLDDARKKGEVARSADLTTAASYAGILLVAVAVGAGSLKRLGEALAGMLENADQVAPLIFGEAASPAVGGIMLTALSSLGAWFIVPGLVALLVILAQRSLVIAPDKLIPKVSRISPIANAKNKFGRGGLFEFAKSFAKLLIYSVLLAVFLWRRAPEVIGAVHADAGSVVAVLLRLVVDFLVIVLVIAVVIGVIDMLWQYNEHMRKNRMSRKELMDETKQSEGDPHIKQQRRQKGYAIAMNQMLADVPQADVVIVNPEHYAVALQWSRESARAPVCLAKGVDEVAARIREAANANGVPIHRDPPTARAIHATVEIGEEIRPDHYQAVAAAIRFAEQIRAKMHKAGWYRNE